MKTKVLVAALSLCVLSTACSKDKNKVKACSEDSIEQVNAIINASYGMEVEEIPSASTEQLESTSEACREFTSNQNSGEVCTATLGGEGVVANFGILFDACGEVDRELANRQSSSNQKTKSKLDSQPSQGTSKMPNFSDMFKMPEDMPDMPDVSDMPDMPDMPDFED